ncbi:MAG: nitroreductase family protein [Rhodospirillales bacterium]|nr:nitroreductase family protein [Rhodospirillales bacterium]
MTDMKAQIAESLAGRFGESFPVPATQGLPALAGMAAHRSIRQFADRPVDAALVGMLCAVALSAPTKSDLQQADIVIVADPAKRALLDEWCGENPWVAAAPVFLVICANNRRQVRIHELRGHAFANDHLDAFFNAAVDAAIVLGAFVTAAEAAGLGTCPVSAIRNRAADVSRLLALPDRVFPVAGLCVGWPAGEGAISPRLPTALRVHRDRYDEGDLDAAIAAYDARRNRTKPFSKQRDTVRFGTAAEYGWSEDKARQYATLERADFGAYIRSIGFKLD